MSVTINYIRTTEKNKHFEGGTSSNLEVLKKTFGNTIAKANIPSLRAMAIAAKDEFYNEVADVVETENEIKFWGTY